MFDTGADAGILAKKQMFLKQDSATEKGVKHVGTYMCIYVHVYNLFLFYYEYKYMTILSRTT